MTEPVAQQAEPTCPRHPDRVTYVRCQRCERPVCPDCQRPAAVGVQCVDCVDEGARTMPTTRTQFGAPTTSGRPVVTMTIIGVCAGLWVAQQLSAQVTQLFAFAPYIGDSEPWRFLTAAFVHSPSSVFHVLMNMLALFQIGVYLEPMLGRLRFGLLYLVSALGGSVGVLLLASPPSSPLDLNSGWFTAVVGASGAVFGLFAALLVVQRHLGRSTAGIGAILVINGVIGFVIPGIAWQAHLGGFITGGLLGLALKLTSAQDRRRYQLPAMLGIAAVLVGLALLKYATV